MRHQMRCRGVAILVFATLFACDEQDRGMVSPPPDVSTAADAAFDPDAGISDWRLVPDEYLWQRIQESGGIAAVALRSPGEAEGFSRQGGFLISALDWDAANAALGATPGTEIIWEDDLLPWTRVRMAGPEVLPVLRALPFVESIEPAYIVSDNLWAFSCETDLWTKQYTDLRTPSGDVLPYAFTLMRIDRAWELATGDNVLIGVMDSGTDEHQQELHSKFDDTHPTRWIQHFATAGQGTCAHGTHTVGTVAAPMNGELNVGVAYESNVISVRQDDRSWGVNSTDAVQALRIVSDAEAKVIVMAFQSPDTYDH